MPRFVVSGFNHLPGQIQRLVKRKLRPESQVLLQPQPDNQYDNTAVSVHFEGQQIGWVAKNSRDKEYIFEALMKGRNNIGYCVTNGMMVGDYGKFRSIEIDIDFTTKRKD